MNYNTFYIKKIHILICTYMHWLPPKSYIRNYFWKGHLSGLGEGVEEFFIFFISLNFFYFWLNYSN